MKVVWLCHFANSELKTYFDTPNVKEFAPWISNLIELFNGITGIELHIIAPNVFTNKDCVFSRDGITYHFYKHLPLPFQSVLLRKAYSFLKIDPVTDYWYIKKKIDVIIFSIEPDLIHLHGAENPYYSAGIIPLLDKYKVLITIQGFIRHSTSDNPAIRKKIDIEERIIKKSKHFGTRTDEMSKTVLEINPYAKLHFHNYPVTIPAITKSDYHGPEFDLVFFARVTRDKGIEDLLNALPLVKREIQSISLHVIGPIASPYFKYLNELMAKLDIVNNVKFIPFFETQQVLFKYCTHAKICILPTYHDIIPGTIIESMFMKLPVIAYAVGGIPSLNEYQETVILVERYNIPLLAQKIVQLLNDADYRSTLAANAYSYALSRFNNQEVKTHLLGAYERICSHDNG